MYLNGYLWGPPDANFKILNDKVRLLNILRLGSNNKHSPPPLKSIERLYSYDHMKPLLGL